MLDFIFRRGNPTNNWRRSAGLTLSVALDEPSINGIPLNSPLNRFSSLGRDDRSQSGFLSYFDLGVTLDYEDGIVDGYSIVLDDEFGEFQPYRGTFSWKGKQLDIYQVTSDELAATFGQWYWMDTDDDESIAFYEYKGHEMQIELTLTGSIKRFNLITKPVMADPECRAGYKVDKPWPPEFGA